MVELFGPPENIEYFESKKEEALSKTKQAGSHIQDLSEDALRVIHSERKAINLIAKKRGIFISYGSNGLTLKGKG